MGRRLLHLPLLAGSIVLLAAGCATAPQTGQGLPQRDKITDFGLEARFALRLERPYEAPQSASGRMSWQHADGQDHIFLANPLGQGIAQIDRHEGRARLRTGDGQVRQAEDASSLLEETTGYRLPIGELPAWLLGRPGPAGRIETDGKGRPRRLLDEGWQIDYDYDSEAAGALPDRLTLRQGNSLELRLRIEEWRSLTP